MEFYAQKLFCSASWSESPWGDSLPTRHTCICLDRLGQLLIDSFKPSTSDEAAAIDAPIPSSWFSTCCCQKAYKKVHLYILVRSIHTPRAARTQLARAERIVEPLAESQQQGAAIKLKSVVHFIIYLQTNTNWYYCIDSWTSSIH